MVNKLKLKADDRLAVGTLNPEIEGDASSNGQIVVVESVRSLHGVSVIKLKGTVAFLNQLPYFFAYKLGRTFNHFGHNTAPRASVNQWGYMKLTDLYDPASDSWRRLDDLNYFREYHALTILVPDGRVIAVGGEAGK